MKRFLLICSFLYLANPGQAQDQAADEARYYADSILQLLSKENNQGKKEDLLNAFYQASVDGFPLVLMELGQNLLKLASDKKDKIIESAAWSALGQGYRLTGNLARALELHQKAVAIAEQSGSERVLAFALNQAGHIYKDRLENEQALKFYHAAMHYNRNAPASYSSFPYSNLGFVHLAIGNLDSALYYSSKARELTSYNQWKSSDILIETNIGRIYSIKGDMARAQEHFTDAIERAKVLKSPRHFSTVYNALAEHCSRMQMYDSAVYFNKLAVDVVQNTVLANLALKPARSLIDYYQNKNADSTVKYWRIYAAANDSLNSTRNNQQIQMLTLEAEQRKRDIEQAKKDSRTKWQTASLIGGLLSAILILTVMARASRRRKRDHDKLAKAYSELRSTQQQLIQAEKMASLGELTAGIAHEIQNPLNFVNNFSEVSTELIDDMKNELKKGDTEEGLAIAEDIKQNLGKILHHGKRADAIVKGMLQHSRSSSGTKEPTDINALCDEYVRLAYHGLRAKDKSFNAQFNFNPDHAVGMVNIVRQDIGRVLLNLINNAFYAVNEKKKQLGDGFEPIVTVSTKLLSKQKNQPISQLANELIISVADNGNGISEANRNKIFQPFFTTKPTGQGTGLGLSLSYDIVKAHGGEIKVESKEGEGSSFTILLPC
jgi:signal transduction histidine kinase